MTGAYIKLMTGDGPVTYRGRTVWSIIRRLLGRSKDISLWLDRCPVPGYTSGNLGWSEGRGLNVWRRVLDCDGPWGIDNLGEDWDAQDEDEDD